MMTLRRLISGNSTNKTIHNHAFIAATGKRESVGTGDSKFIDTLRCWAARFQSYDRYGKVLSYFKSNDDGNFWSNLVAWLNDVQGETWIWSSNAAATFALLDGWERIDGGLVKIEFAAIDKGCFILKCLVYGHRVVFLDVHGWIRSSVEEICDAIGWMKWHKIGDDDSDNYRSSVCTSTVNLVGECVNRLLAWHRSADLGCLRYTVAAQAMQLWMHRLGPRIEVELLSHKQSTRVTGGGREYVYPLVHSSDSALMSERDCCYGPTNIVYKVGKVDGPVYSLDVQSAYPVWMRDNAYPVRLVSRIENCNVRRLKQLVREYGVIASVLIRNATYDYPVRCEHRTLRCRGSFWTRLPGPELRYALDAGEVDQCSVAYLYEERNIFPDWSQWVTTERARCRESGDKLIETIVKSLANSLHGKFAQRAAKWIDLPKEQSDQHYGLSFHVSGLGQPAKCRRFIGGHVQELADPTEHRNAFPAIASWVNSYARLRMHELCEYAGIGNYYYVYTDSIHVNREGFDSLCRFGCVNAGEIGKLKLDATYQWVHYYAPGRYETDLGRKCAGLSDDYWIDDNGDLCHYRQVGAAEMVQSQLSSGTPVHGQLVRQEKYRLNETAGGRMVDNRGWTHSPILTYGD